MSRLRVSRIGLNAVTTLLLQTETSMTMMPLYILVLVKYGSFNPLWMKAIGLLQDNELNPIADYLFNDGNGQDPYIEDIGTLWLLHFMLINTQYATIYKTTFVDYHRQRNIIEKADCRTILSILV